MPTVTRIAFSLAAATSLTGAKGCSEAGTIGAPAAIINAVVDALAPLGIVDIEMPATSERVWRAMASSGKPSMMHHWICRGSHVN
jgi:CO/xanthine dehydrogenase Mo-binding subunit